MANTIESKYPLTVALYIKAFWLCIFSFQLFAMEENVPKWAQQVQDMVEVADKAGCATYPQVPDLDSQFLCENLLLEISNQLYQNWQQEKDIGSKVGLIKHWWSMDETSSLTNPMIRLHLAALIGQSRLSDVCEQREYSRKYVFSDNVLIQGNAIVAIGWVGNSKDVLDLITIVRTEEEGIAEDAVLSLLILANEPATLNRLRELSGKVKRDSLRTFIDKQLAFF